MRLVSATHRALRREVEEGRFREDLMYRLRVVPIFLPRLVEREGDIEALLWRFVQEFNDRGSRRIDGVDEAAMKLLLDYAWPGNVRELHNVVERACAYAAAEYIQIDDLPDHLSGRRLVRRRPKPETTTVAQAFETDLAPTFKEAKSKYLEGIEKNYVETLLTRNSWNISHAAREASIDRKYLRKLMAKHEVAAPKKDDAE